MAREITNPRIMLLSGGIEFTRTENRIASFETLMEQEGKYMEILVGRIVKLKPDVLLVGRAVSRRAQELLIKARVVLMQHVKSSLLNRISRQTGAKIISSTDHIMNQFGAHVLGKCHRFRIIVARDNEVWIDGTVMKEGGKQQRNIAALLNDPKLPNHERQAALAANMLGEGILDGAEAVKSGLAKRGVSQTYVMMEGCPKQLGCTVVLRGASRAALKQVKIVFRFLVNAAYNLRLETAYLKERCARLSPEYQVQEENLCSSSLCVDYGAVPSGRKVRPWNGGSNNDGVQRSISGKVTAFDHQAILISSVWMTDKTQCCPAEVKGICYYSMQDVSLGQFLRDSCFNLSLKCQNPTCKKSVLDHSLSFVHNDGLINITVDHMDDPLPPAPLDGSRKVDGSNKDEDDEDSAEDSPIATWTYCKNCGKIVTPLVYISDNTWKYSFGKFLESFFYNRYTVMNSPQHKCGCELQTSGILFFGCGRLAARFTYERLRPFGVFVRKHLPIESAYHRSSALRHLELISMASSQLFVKFDKHIEKVSREARSLLGNSANRSDHLQTLLSELNRIGSEVDHAAKTLQEKIASVSDKCSKDGEVVVSDALLRFPWFARRYLFMLTSAWNEKLSAAGQAIVAMKKLASSASQRNDSVMGPNVPTIVGDPNSDELHEGMRRLRQLHEVYSRYNITDISTVLPIIPGNSKAELEYDDDFEDPDGTMDFNDGVDADVLASRRRLYNPNSLQSQGEQSRPPPTKSLGTRRIEEPRSRQQHRISPETIPSSTVSTKVTPGGAVKSAITRFFNRGGRESDPYVVNLGIFKEGRPRLEPGVNGVVVPVIDDQLCTVIAYSLSSTEYFNQFENFVKMESSNPDSSSTSGTSETPPTPLSDSGGAQRVRSNLGDSHQVKSPSSHASSNPSGPSDKQGIERRMLVRSKSHIKHTFRDYDEKGQNLCKFVCTTYWATQFHAVRQAFLSPNGVKDSPESNSGQQYALDVEQSYVQSLSSAYSWAASGGKSGASFARTSDDRFVIKCISRTELQMFLDCAPAYFEYLSKAFFHGL
jgi:1-phosphatidylinositol-3-phosphate 5-kinase